MARTIADVALALDVAVGPTRTDLRSLPRPEASWLAALDDPHVPVRGRRTRRHSATPRSMPRCRAACDRAVGVLESLGAEVDGARVRLRGRPGPHDFLTFTAACTLRTLQPLADHPRWEEVDPLLRHLTASAESTTAVELLRVFDRFHTMNLRLVSLFHKDRILVTPTCSATSPFAGEMTAPVDGEPTVNWVQFTSPST